MVKRRDEKESRSLRLEQRTQLAKPSESYIGAGRRLQVSDGPLGMCVPPLCRGRPLVSGSVVAISGPLRMSLCKGSKPSRFTTRCRSIQGAPVRQMNDAVEYFAVGPATGGDGHPWVVLVLESVDSSSICHRRKRIYWGGFQKRYRMES